MLFDTANPIWRFGVTLKNVVTVRNLSRALSLF
jgi:hypothetical protein